MEMPDIAVAPEERPRRGLESHCIPDSTKSITVDQGFAVGSPSDAYPEAETSEEEETYEQSIAREFAQSVIQRSNVFTSAYVPLDYVLDQIIRRAFVYCLTGCTGSGKTSLLVSLSFAMAMNRADIIGHEVQHAAVVYVTLENPDDVRMRIRSAARFFSIDLDALGQNLFVVSKQVSPEDLYRALRYLASKKPLGLIVYDTLQAGFDGKDRNDPVETVKFIRRLRRLTELNGRPALVIAAHPVKDAHSDNLIPAGSGAVLNEIDGNLTLWKRRKGQAEHVELSHQGKFRGPSFDPVSFRLREFLSPAVVDVKGQQVSVPLLVPVEGSVQEVPSEPVGADDFGALLRVMVAFPDEGQREWGRRIGKSATIVNRRLQKLRERGLVAKDGHRWFPTPAGQASCVATA